MSQFISNIPGFMLTAFLLAMVPGQGVAMILRQSILGGARAAVFSVLGNSSGLVVWGTLSSLGLSAVFAASATAYNILKWSGVAFLGFLSIQTLLQLKNQSGRFEITGEVFATPKSAYRLGIITNLTNVKAAVFAVAFVPAFVPREFNLGLGIFILGLVWAITSMSWYLILILMVDQSSRYLARPQVRRVLTGLSALGILFLAIGLALSKQH
ncbi:MAG: LysE family translocator [Cyclobacteriaceae bacterium]|nr:LysE family translocator [Cyclobacteriaceae bacterium]